LAHGLDAQYSDAALTAGADYVGGGGLFLSSTPSSSGIDVWAVNVEGLALERDQTTDHDHLGEQWWVSYELDVIPVERLRLLPKTP